jgi:heat shock protein HslJ
MMITLTRLTLTVAVGLIADLAVAQTSKPGPPGTSQPGSNRPLEATYWKAIELAGKPLPTQDATREAHLVFQTGGRLSGSDGCNRIVGSYELKGDGIAFRQTATPPRLQGTAWQLVKFQGGDDTTLTPDEKAKYTIEFSAGGRLTVRIDCNRGRGTWKSTGPGQLEFGPLALTRAQCPPGSLHDRIVKQWSLIRSYVLKDGHLFLALMADGGTYEFEPAAKAQAPPPR